MVEVITRQVASLNHPDFASPLLIIDGITEYQVAQLIVYSANDPEVIKKTSDPLRFRDWEAFVNWRKKGRVIYTLADGAETLVGVLWIGESHLPEKRFTEPLNSGNYGATLAMRLYQQARGTGLAIPFWKLCLRDYFDYLGVNSTGIWLESLVTNNTAHQFALRIGFRKVSGPDERNKIIFVTEFANIRNRLDLP